MKKLIVLSFVFCFILQNIIAQNVGIGTTTPNASAALDITSTSKGFLPPRMTTAQRNLISSPAPGLIIYNTDCNTFNYWNSTAWVPFFGTSISAGATTFGSSAPCNGTSNVITLNKPTGVTSGNVLIAAITQGNSTITPPSGWTLISFNTGWSPSYVYYKVAGVSEPANYTWTFNAGEYASGVVTNFTGTFCTSLVSASSVEVTSVYTASSITTASPNQMLVVIFSGGSGLNTWSTPAGMTAGYSGGQNCTSTAIFHGVQAVAGPSGPKTGTPSIAAGNGIAYLIALQ